MILHAINHVSTCYWTAWTIRILAEERVYTIYLIHRIHRTLQSAVHESVIQHLEFSFVDPGGRRRVYLESFVLQFLYLGHFVWGQDLCEDPVDSSLASNGASSLSVVTGQKDDVQPHAFQRVHSQVSLGFHRVSCVGLTWPLSHGECELPIVFAKAIIVNIGNNKKY